MPDAPQTTPTANGAFRTTRWTQVSRSKADSPTGRKALAELCEDYYEPVATFLKYQLNNEEEAQDLAQEFFSKMLEGDAIARADQQLGKFRSYLLGAVKHFLSHHREASRRLKRGGGSENVSLHDDETGEARPIVDATASSPDHVFDRQWALTTLANTLQALESECTNSGRGEFFEKVKPWLTGEAEYGDQTSLAAECGMNANALKVAIHRMKKRFRELLKEEIAGTLTGTDGVEDEMQTLFTALGQ